MHAVRVGLAAVLGSLTLCACELGDPVGGGPVGQDTTVTLLGTPALDGFVGGNGAVLTSGGGFMGDIASVPNFGFRQFFSFAINTIPPGSTVVSATLRLFQMGAVGNPFTDLGSVVVDHVDYGTALDALDYAIAPLSIVGTLSSTDVAEYKQITVTPQVQLDVASTSPRSQFRLRWSAADFNTDGQSDYVPFVEAGQIGGNEPMLVVRYRAPAP